MSTVDNAAPLPHSPKDVPTAEEAEVIEPEGQSLVTDITPTMSHMDTVILAASKLEEYGKARNAIMNFIIKQSYPGDWISHSLESINKMDRNANLGAAGCERIANLLGIKELNWKKPVKEWSENKLHFTYVTEADFEFAGRRIHVVHRVGTRDTFWTTEYEWKNEGGRNIKMKKVKPMADVREDYIEKASFRGARKEGVRTLMGLRNVPLAKLAELGFNIEHVHYASFRSDKKIKQDESGQVIGAKAGDGKSEYTLSISNISEMRQGKKGPYFIVLDISGDKFYLHADDKSDHLKTLQAAAFGEYKVKIKYREDNGFKSIDEVISVEGEESK
jgi:hypothetical protein